MGEELRLTAQPRRLELSEPFVISRGVEHWYDVVEVGVAWRGETGWGEATPIEHFGESVESVLAFVRRWDGRLGDDPFALEAIGRELGREPGDRAAQAGIDAALHDLCGKLAGLPTWQYLGLPRLGPATVQTVSLGPPEAMAARAAAEAERGRHLLKLKLGGRDGLDVERVAQVRAATELPIVVDVNEYWSFAEAVDAIPRLAELGVRYVEQPLPAGDPAGVALKERSELPLIADEDCHTLADVAGCAQRAHGINIKLAKCGGIREAMRMVHAARALSLTVMLGCMGESSLGIAAHAVVAGLCDLVDLDGNLSLVADTWTGVELVDGVQRPSCAPGLGVSRCR
jgi:L-alanine-DL-glutamate epimerase-like enolase superfamily enzyme